MKMQNYGETTPAKKKNKGCTLRKTERALLLLFIELLNCLKVWLLDQNSKLNVCLLVAFQVK
jgi:hypothetical protein